MPRTLSRNWFAATVVRPPLVIMLILGTGLSGGCSNGEVQAADSDSAADTGTPFVIEPERRHLLTCSDADWQTLVDKILPSLAPQRLGPSGCLHAMRLLGTDLHATADDDSRDVEPTKLLDMFFHAERARAAFRVPLIFPSRYGIRYRRANPLYPVAGKMRESHQGQVFASLAEMGVPLDSPIRLKGTVYRVEDVLADAVAGFDFRGEIEWKCIAAMHYLADRGSWRNRYGEIFRFDDVADELIGRDISRASCGGTHLFHAINLLVRVDADRSVLSSAARDRARRHLEIHTRLALASQRSDGSWPHTWWRGQPDAAVTESDPEQIGSVLVTGHLAESLLYLPRDLSVEDDVLRRAGLWLLGRLREATPAECKAQLCPLTHAACVVRQLR
ncbi:MAG: hypothetical protein NXI31_17840 [bacterium]|nr:hypothetical protein [bacterium]